jgi:mannose-1-phosphate guanylyltransferase
MTALAAMALAAGYGTRLAPLTDELAKPACPVVNRPLLHFSLQRLVALGASTVVVNTHHLPATVRAALDPPPFGLDVRIVHEPVILGTGGALKNAWAELVGAPFQARFPGSRPEGRSYNESIVLLNGDTICEADLAAAAAEHRRSGAVATMVLLDDPRAARYGAVETAEDGAVVDIAGRRGRRGARRGLFTGAHLLSPQIFECLPPEAAFCIIRQVYLPLLASRPGAVRATYGAGRFFDLGTPADYLEAHRALLDDPGPFAFFRDGLTEIAPGVWAHPAAEISPRAELRGPAMIGRAAVIEDGARVGPYAAVGAHARVAALAELDHCVVWDGVVVRGAIHEVIATPRNVVAL